MNMISFKTAKFWKELAILVIFFIPINYLAVVIHEYGHVVAAYLTGGWYGTMTIYPSLFTGGETYCGGGATELVDGAGMLLTSAIALICAWKGGYWKPVALIFGARMLVGMAKWVYYYQWCSWSDTTALVQLGTPLAYLMIILPVLMSAAAVVLCFIRE